MLILDNVNFLNLGQFFAVMLEFMMFVLIVPGSINTIFIPNGLSSYAIDSLNASIANLVLEYAEIPGKLMRPVIALMLTIILLLLLLLLLRNRSFFLSFHLCHIH